MKIPRVNVLTSSMGIFSLWIPLLCGQNFGEAAELTGTATYRERIALPPGAVFEATLQDVSKADAAATVIGSVKLDRPAQPPFRFAIPYDATRIDQSRNYAVRASITQGGRLMFTSDQAYPVLTRGHASEVKMMLRMVASAKQAEAGSLRVLPATFAGELPCADCLGIRYHLNLFPDRVFFLRMTYLGRGDDAFTDDIGTWVLSSDHDKLLLAGGKEATERFAIQDRATLRKLDVEGREIESALNYNLRREKSFAPLEPRLVMRGMYRYFADAGLFTECLTGRRWPVAQEQDNAALESSYTKARLTAGEELLVNLEGRIATRPRAEGRGFQATLLVDRFIGILPGETCGARFSAAPLASTFWKLTQLGDKPVIAKTGAREPHLIFDGVAKRVAGSGGCNRLTGPFQLSGNQITLGKLAMTFMACAEGMESEREFLLVLEQVRSWNIFGRQLELFAGDGKRLARFMAQPSK